MTDREELMERLHKSRMLMGRAAAMDPALGKIEQDLYDAIAALQQESPRAVVKPLEWEGSKRTSRTKEESDWWATSSVSDYWIERTAKRFRLTFNGSQLGGLYLTLDEAKAAAQADYEQRILSALAHPLHQPAPEAGKAVKPVLYLTETGDAITVEYDGAAVKALFDRLEAPAVGRKLLPLYAAPAPEPQAPVPDGVTDEMVEAAARAMADVIGKRHEQRDGSSWLNEERREEARAALTAANERSR